MIDYVNSSECKKKDLELDHINQGYYVILLRYDPLPRVS